MGKVDTGIVKRIAKIETLFRKLAKRELAQALTDVTRFLSAKSHSISGLNEIRQEQVSTWQGQYGYDFVNFNNFDQWVDFLEWYKDMKDYGLNQEEMDECKSRTGR